VTGRGDEPAVVPGLPLASDFGVSPTDAIATVTEHDDWQQRHDALGDMTAPRRGYGPRRLASSQPVALRQLTK
jgi:hypothetical protein